MNFFNSGAKVQKHTTGYSSAEVIYEGVGLNAKETIIKNVITENAHNTNNRHKKIEKQYSYDQQTSSIIESFFKKEGMVKSVDESYHEGKCLIFKDILFEAFMQSLYLDDDFKVATKESLYSIVSDFIDERGGFNLLEHSTMSTKSPFLQNIKLLCESTARNACNRKLAEENGDVGIDFSLNTEEEKAYTYSKDNLGIDELADLVKNKVLTVVKDEKNKEKKEAELLQDLADDVDKSVEEIEEAIQQASIGGPIVEEGTLFNALFRSSYNQYLTEACSKKNISESDDSWNEDEEEFELDMDVILAETITKYTLMELAYTIQLENYSQDHLRRSIEKMLNK